MIEMKLSEYIDPYTGKDLISAKIVQSIRIEENQVLIDLVFGYPFETNRAEMIKQISDSLSPIISDKKVLINPRVKIDRHGKEGIQGLPNIKNIIAVGSGKGGVGKSTIAVNLALALAKEGANVGLLDADIYGPSQPSMLGSTKEKPVVEDGKLLPIKRYGLQSMSIGYLIDAQAPMVWRGPMLGKALQQLLQDTKWESLDYLIVDLPPGTGDVQLTLCQKMPVSAALIVTTPQDIALIDVRRACEMFNKLNVPILGIIENMSLYHCSQCGHEEPIFGEGGGDKLASEFHIPLLASLPLNLEIRKATDAGEPIVVKSPDSIYAKTFGKLALKTAARLSLQPKDYSILFPKVVVADSNINKKGNA